MAKKLQSTGFGESRPHIAPEEAFEPRALDWSKLTVNGEPIPEHLHGLLPYEMTDQGVAEKNEGKEPSRVQFLSDETDKQVLKYRDQLKGTADFSFEEAKDPLAVAMEKHLPKGHRGLFMSEQKCNTDGMQRGVLAYEPVLVENNGVKERVKVGGMFLASVPEDVARKAERFYVEKAARMAGEATDKVREQSNQVFSDSKLQRMDARKGGGFEFGVTHEEDGEVMGEIPHEVVG